MIFCANQKTAYTSSKINAPIIKVPKFVNNLWQQMQQIEIQLLGIEQRNRNRATQKKEEKRV